MNAAKQTRKPDVTVAVVMPESGEIGLIDYKGGKIPFGKLQLDFKDGRGLMLDSLLLTPEVIGQALMHGLKQKLVDAAAITRDPETGRSATIETKFTAIEAVMNRLLNGEWNKRRDGVQTGGLLKRALVEKYEGRKTPEQIQAFLDSKSDKEKAALRKNPQIAEIIERLRAEDAKETGEDLPDLLAELEADADAGDGAAESSEEAA